ncbi:hypothetical protein EVA_08319 [gut metagenome]|uniref:Uncharacterized protein n=1 Tax=gut metagenome TaxID=749906 RepID=J9G8N8_9ZZZZ
MIYRQPAKLIIQLEDANMGQLIYYWNYYNKPCSLVVQKAKTEGLNAIRLNMDNADAGSLVWALMERLGAYAYYEETKQPADMLDLFM